MAAGNRAFVTKSTIDSDWGALLSTLRAVLNEIDDRHSGWWSQYGPSGYMALGASQADADELNSAIAEAVSLSKVYHGLATVASGGAVADGEGHNFDTFLTRCVGNGR